MGSESEGSFKGFNRTGDEETADVILRPQVDPGLRIKRAVMIAIVLVLLVGIGAIALQKSRLSLNFGSQEDGRHLAPPQQQVD